MRLDEMKLADGNVLEVRVLKDDIFVTIKNWDGKLLVIVFEDYLHADFFRGPRYLEYATQDDSDPLIKRARELLKENDPGPLIERAGELSEEDDDVNYSCFAFYEPSSNIPAIRIVAAGFRIETSAEGGPDPTR